MKKFSTISYILSAAILIFAGAVVVRASWCDGTNDVGWCAPSGSPSAITNAPEPLNKSGIYQSKSGALGLDSLDAAFYIDSPVIGVGFSPLEINSLTQGLYVKDGDIILDRPTPKSGKLNNNLILKSAGSVSSLITDPQNGFQFGLGSCASLGVSDTCKLSNGTTSSTTQFSCGSSSKSYNGYSCNDYYDVVDVQGGRTCYLNKELICSGGGSSYSLKNNVGNLEFTSSNSSVPIMSLDNVGNLIISGKITAKGTGWEVTGDDMRNTNSGNINLNGKSNFYNGASIANASAITFYPGILSAQAQTTYTDWAAGVTPVISEWYNLGTGGQSSDTCSKGNMHETFTCDGTNTQAKCFDVADVKIGTTNYGQLVRQISCVATNGTYAVKSNVSDNSLDFIYGSGSKEKISFSHTGVVSAKQFSTGDLIFNHDGRPVWIMDEDENGLYVKSPITGKKYKMMMEEIK